MTTKKQRLAEASSILVDLGLPRAQINDRTALCLLALLDLSPKKPWTECISPLIGITPIMEWARQHYRADYAANTRETFRRQSMHQFIEAGVCLYNPDKLDRPVNSPKAVYQIEPNLLEVIRCFGTPQYEKHLADFQRTRKSLIEKYAKARDANMVPVSLADGRQIKLSPGDHSKLIKKVTEDFVSRFAPGGELVYVGDTGDKHGFLDVKLLASLGIKLDNRGKMPDVVIFLREKNWLLLVEAVTSHGPVDAKRQGELSKLFGKSKVGLVYVSAFPTRKIFAKYDHTVAWESEVWIADAPSHLIHFNGVRFLGPYDQA